MSGEPLEPVLPHTAAAQQRGAIGVEHVKIIRRFFDRLPGFVDYETREVAEAQLAEIACGLKPEELRQAADQLAYLIDQDGQLSDGDRARRRYLTIDKQGPDGLSDIRGRLDPETCAAMEAVFATWAAPGMCNPDDEDPCVDGEPSGENVSGDARSTGSATTTRSKPCAGRCWRRDSWAATTGYPPRSSSPPHSKSWNPAWGMRSPAAALCCRCRR